MSEIEAVLTFLFVLAVFYGIMQRKKRKSAESCVQGMKNRFSQLCEQRNTLAREYLLHVIPAEKIQKVAKRQYQQSLTFVIDGSLHGLVASSLNEEELAIMDKVDSLLDGRIRRDGDRFQIPE